MPTRAFIIAAFGAFVQYYDYHLFGFLALKLAKHFFSDKGIFIQLQNTYLIMGIAMISKPIGALLLGKIGDIYGRSNVFNISLIGTAIGSFIICIVPDYNYIGILASILLLIARMIICALVSSGTDSIRIYIYEHVGNRSQVLGVSITNIFMQAGSFMSSCAAWFFTLDFMPDYGWRLAFLLGSCLGVFTMFLTKKYDIKDFINLKHIPQYDKFKNLPITKIVNDNFKLFIFCTIIAGCIGSTTQFFIIFFGTYNFGILKNIGQSSMQFYISIALCIYMIFSLISGYIADKIGCMKVALSAIVILLLISLGHVVNLSNNKLNLNLLLLTSAILPFLTMPSAVILKQSIPIVIRYRIFSLAHAIGSILISAPTAFTSTWLYNNTGISWLPMIYFIITMILIFISLIKIKNFMKSI